MIHWDWILNATLAAVFIFVAGMTIIALINYTCITRYRLRCRRDYKDRSFLMAVTGPGTYESKGGAR